MSLLLTDFTHFSGVFIVEFKQGVSGWAIAKAESNDEGGKENEWLRKVEVLFH